MNVLLLFFLFIFAGPAFSQALPTYIGGPTGGTLVPGALSNVGAGFRTVAANSSLAGETLIKDAIRVPIGAANADMFAVRSIAFADALAVGSRLIPLIGTAALLYTAYQGVRCYQTNGSWLCDPGKAPTSVLMCGGAVNGPFPYSTCDAAMAVYGPNWAASQGDKTFVSVAYVSGDRSAPNQPILYHINWVYKGGTVPNSTGMTVYTGNGPGCVSGVLGLDGRCPLGSASPVTETEAAARALPYVDKSAAPAIVQQALQNGLNLAPVAKPSLAQGPASLSQPVSTKTVLQPNGTTSVQTTQVTNNITYSGDTYHVTNTTVINNPDGSKETTTEEPQKDPCEAKPNSLGCADLGDPPTDQPSWQTKTVSFQAESLGLAASCPSPWSGTVHGWNLQMSWQPACDVAPQIRLGVLALCTLGALLMIVTTVRT